MIECPECGNSMRGKKCGCGYTIKSFTEGPAVDLYAFKIKGDNQHLKDCKSWLINQGIVTEGMTRTNRSRALSAYRESLKTKPKPEGTVWASTIMERLADGEWLPLICQRMAEEALGLKK